jgi:hypothetical protein
VNKVIAKVKDAVTEEHHEQVKVSIEMVRALMLIGKV